MENLLNYKEAAQYLSLKLGTIYAMVSRKQIPHIRLNGRLVRFNKSELDKWIKNREVHVKTGV